MKRNVFTRIIAALTASILTLTALVSCADNSDPSTVTSKDGKELQVLRVALMTGSPDQYAAYIGTEQGIFEKYGIYLKTTEHVAGINTMDAVQNGTADTGLLADFAAANRIGNTLHDTNLVIFSELSVGASTLGGLYVAPQYADDLSSLDGSAGWITNIGTVSEYYNWQAQTYIGVDPDKQNIVQTDSNQTSLALVQNGDASAVVATGSSGNYYEERGWVLVAKSNEIGISVGSYLLTTKDFLAGNTELLANYLKALKESIDYISANLDAVAPEIEAKFGIKADDFKANWQSYLFRIGVTEEGAQKLDEINAWAYSHGKYSEQYNIRDFIDTSAAKIADPDSVTIEK